MLSIGHCPSILARVIPVNNLPHKLGGLVVCCARGPRPRFPRVWKTQKRIGTISKSQKLVDSIKKLSNVKEEVYGALDSFIAWELEFPLIIVKKALKTLEFQKEWKRIIQMVKWMLSKGQGQTMGTYYTLLNALAEDGRLEEAEELWTKIFSQYLESLPRIFFTKMISLYYNKGSHDKMFEVFADMEELRVRPDKLTVRMVGDVFQRLGMLDKYEKLHKKYPPPKWEYRYFKGKRVKIRVKQSSSPDNDESGSEIRAKYLGASNGNKSEIEMPAGLLTASYDDEAETTMQLRASDDDEAEITMQLLASDDEAETTMQLPASDDDEAETTMQLLAFDDDEVETTIELMQLPASDDEVETTMLLPASDNDEAETTMQLSAYDDDEAETTMLLPASDDDEAETMLLPASDDDEAEAQIGMEQFTVTE